MAPTFYIYSTLTLEDFYFIECLRVVVQAAACGLGL